MSKALKLAAAFAAASTLVAGAAYGTVWAVAGLRNLLVNVPESTTEFSDNGLRILWHDYRGGSTGGRPRDQSYALLLDTEEFGIVACHGLRSWPQNTWVGQVNDGAYPDTLYANSPLAELVFKKSDQQQDTDGILSLGSCFQYETPLTDTTINSLGSNTLDRRHQENTALADIGSNHPHWGLPIMEWQDRSFGVTIATESSGRHIHDTERRIRGDITYIASPHILNDTIRDRRYLSVFNVIRGETSTRGRHAFTPEIC
ncbi:MAG: hypothetical protein ACK4VI_09285, partial [Alphaproteobacteria bacterium]